ncbi:MAG: DUF3794 domain-containing protein, partial [Eubacterium sp.]
NQSRLDIHNSFALNIRACAGQPVQMIESVPDVLVRRDSVKYFSLAGTAYARAEFEEDAAIPADSEVVKRIINTFSNVHTDEVKIIKNKMLVKATAEFSLLYTTDTDNEIIRKCEKTVSISKIIDIIGIDEDDHAVVNVNAGNMYVKPKADKNNELRMIELLGDVNISVSVFREISAELSTDSYATDNEITNTFSKLNLNTNGVLVSDIINEKCTFDFDNINITEVIDLSLNITDGKNLELAAFIRNEKSEVIFISQKKEISIPSFSASAVYIKSFDYVINSSNQINVRYLIEYTAVKFEEKAFHVLSDIKVSDKPMPDSPALVVYFAKEKEALWDIAKKFRTSVELIKSENELREDVLDARRILLIPGM